MLKYGPDMLEADIIGVNGMYVCPLLTIGFYLMLLLTCHDCSYTDDRSKLDDLGQEFFKDTANAHLFPVLEDPEMLEPEPEPEPVPQPKKEKELS